MKSVEMITSAVGLALLTLFMSSCAADPTLGYSSQSTFPRDYATVAVPIFENRTFERDIEFELADALVKAIETRTDYKIMQEDRADTILTGRIIDISRDRISKSRNTGLAEEVVLSVVVNFEWKDTATGKIIKGRDNFVGTALFTPSRPSGEPIELARFGVVEQLASDIVDEMRSAW